MGLYESIFIIRQDIASADVDKVVADFEELIKKYKGEIVKKEYWGLRNLAYEIANNKKGHYYFLGIKADNDLLSELDRKIRLSESIIRHSVVKVQQLEEKASIILRNEDNSTDETVDVTIKKDKERSVE